MKEDQRPVIRGTAAWALGKIGSEAAENELISAKEQENDGNVAAEINKGLQMIQNQGIH